MLQSKRSIDQIIRSRTVVAPLFDLQKRWTHERYKPENRKLFTKWKTIKPYPVGPKEDWNKGIPNYEWKTGRSKKMPKPILPDFDEMRLMDRLTPDEMRSLYKKKGIIPHRSWREKPIFIGCTSDVIEPYIPPEGDGAKSFLTKEVIDGSKFSLP